MKKAISIFFLCFILLLNICGCGKTDTNNNTEIKHYDTFSKAFEYVGNGV